MNDTTLRALAENLAHQAVHGEPDPMVKAALGMDDIKTHLSGVMANPAARNALLGAGAGGLVGLLTADPEERKEKALQYALLGGLGAGGLTLGANMLGKATAPPPKAIQAPIKSKLGPVMTKGVGPAAGAAAALAAAGYAPIAARQAGPALRRGAMSAAWKIPALRGPVISALRSKIPGEMAKNIGGLSRASKIGVPAAGALLMYSLLNRGNR